MGGTNSAMAINGIHLLLLFKFIDAGYPPNIEAFFKLTSKNTLAKDASPTPEPFLFLQINASLYRSNWYRFGEYASTVNFLSNCGTTVMTCMLALTFTGTLEIVKKIVKPKSALFHNVLYKFKWNLILSSVAGCQSKFALAWFLQFWEPVFDIYGILNLVVAALSSVGVMILTIFSIRHTKWNWGITRDRLFMSRKSLEVAEPRQKQFAFITNDYMPETSIGRYFFVVSFAKVFMTVAIIFWLPRAPVAQAYMVLLLTLFFIITLFVGKPHKELEKRVSILTNEIIMLLQAGLVAVFATNKQIQFLSLNQGMVIGWFFIGLILLALVVNPLFTAFSILKVLVSACKKKKRKPRGTQRMISLDPVENPTRTPPERRLQPIGSLIRLNASHVLNDSNRSL